MRAVVVTVLAVGVLSCAPVAQPPATHAGTTPAAVAQHSGVERTPTTASSAGPGWTPTQGAQPWYSIPFLPVDSWEPYG